MRACFGQHWQSQWNDRLRPHTGVRGICFFIFLSHIFLSKNRAADPNMAFKITAPRDDGMTRLNHHAQKSPEHTVWKAVHGTHSARDEVTLRMLEIMRTGKCGTGKWRLSRNIRTPCAHVLDSTGRASGTIGCGRRPR